MVQKRLVLRPQRDLHHIGEALLALLCGGDLRGDEAVRDGQQAGGILAQHLSVGEECKTLHLHAEAAALVPQQLPVSGLCVGGLTIEDIGGVDVALDELDALLLAEARSLSFSPSLGKVMSWSLPLWTRA